MISDITERKRAEAALQKEHRNLNVAGRASRSTQDRVAGVADRFHDPQLLPGLRGRCVHRPLVHEVVGVKVLSMHLDISTVTGEEVVLFSLTEAPHFF